MDSGTQTATMDNSRRQVASSRRASTLPTAAHPAQTLTTQPAPACTQAAAHQVTNRACIRRGMCTASTHASTAPFRQPPRPTHTTTAPWLVLAGLAVLALAPAPGRFEALAWAAGLWLGGGLRFAVPTRADAERARRLHC